MAISSEQASWCAESLSAFADSVEQTIHGKRHVIDFVLATALAGGHVFLEPVPGTGKAPLARTVAPAVDETHSRTQSTPDPLSRWPMAWEASTAATRRRGDAAFSDRLSSDHFGVFEDVRAEDDLVEVRAWGGHGRH